jgi:hypothetical protein
MAFPANPSQNQVYSDGTSTWMWDGTRWVPAATGAVFLPLKGRTDGLPAGAGEIGEVQTFTVNTGIVMGAQAWMPTSGPPWTLTPGSWLLSGTVTFAPNAPAAQFSCGILDATVSPPPTLDNYTMASATSGGFFGANHTLSMPSLLINRATSITFGVMASCAASGGPATSCTGWAHVFARRIR